MIQKGLERISKSLILILISVIFVSSFLVLDSPVVSTENGKVRGIMRTQDGQFINQFFKIPYAEPPIGELRFRKPVATGNWTGVLDASKHGPTCPQSSKYLFSSEDCLFLNIYVPGEIHTNNRKAVMVWIHGGGYVAGSGNLYDGSYLALNGDVIVVTINYRLGILGFLSTEDENAAGNYGLWDQIQALKWIKENVGAFGGDANKITIFGESAGGYSVGILSMLPETKGLFDRVIAESGVAFSPRAITRDARKTMITIAETFNCTNSNVTTGNLSSVVTCLRKQKADDFVNVAIRLLYQDKTTPNFIMRFGPVVDRDLIPNTPTELLSKTTSESYALYLSRDFMAGTNNGDGGLIVNYYPPYPDFNITEGVPVTIFCNRIVTSVARDYFNSSSTDSNAMCLKYTATNFTLSAQALKSVDFYGDFDFAAPAVRSLNVHLNSTKNTFQYLFSHIPQESFVKMPPWFQRANHGNEVPFVFGIQHVYPHVSRDEIMLSNLMMSYWTNFAKFGNPNGMNSAQHYKWPSYKTNSSYLELNITPTVGTELYQDRMEFWLNLIPNISRKDVLLE